MRHEIDGRREIASRNIAWADIIARKLTDRGITPNQISMMSVFSVLAGCFLLTDTVIYPDFNKYVAYILFIVCIQSQLLCNLFGGMVAMEGRKKSTNGDLYNDMSDRSADALSVILVGYVAGGFGIELGWLAALLVITAAYFHWMGVYRTQQHFLSGPMTKQHRTALLTLYFMIATCTIHWGHKQIVCLITLILMNVGLIATLIHRSCLMSHASNEAK